MSGANSDNKMKVKLPTVISQLLQGLRSRIRRYSVFSGFLFCVSAAGLVFWLTSGIDAGWFALQRLELPVGFRLILFAVMAVVSVWLLLSQVLLPLVRRHKDRELALLLERRFPEFQDGLVTTVEGADGYPGSGPVVESMLQRTVEAASNVALKLSPDAVFNLAPLKKRGWLAGLLVVSVVGQGIAAPGSLRRWWSAFVSCEDTYHLRTTTLDFRVVAQPGDRKLEFRRAENALTYLHARGADFELEMTVPEGDSDAGQPWVVPQRVRVDVIREDGSRSRTYVSAASGSGRTFRFILTRLQEPVTIEVLAGDFRPPLPLSVQAVTPPSIYRMVAECEFPDYTGWNEQRDRVVSVLGSELSLPTGTRFQLEAECNKPLQSARIVTDLFEIYGDRDSCELIAREGFSGDFQAAGPLLSPDGLRVQAAFLLQGEDLSQAASDLVAATADSSLQIASNTSLRFFLHDEDDIMSTTQESIRIRAIADKAPVIATRTSGVTNSITRRAIIPVVGTIQDDYGLQSGEFQFMVDDESQWRPRPFRIPMPSGVTEFELGFGDQSKQERFDVQPLDLTEGQTLSLTVVATDGCTEPGTNVSRAEPVVFRIVSNEELLSVLYSREVNLRRQFEELIQKLEQVRDDLQFNQALADRIEAAAAGSVSPEDRVGLTECARRSGDTLRRQDNELQAIVASFEEIVEQLINNAIPPQQLAENMRTSIVAPMKAVSETLMVTADRSISRFRVAASGGQPAAELLSASISDVTSVVFELRRILENVRDMAEFHEVLSDLNDILEEQQRIQKETNIQQIKNLGLGP
ncbi:MAG: hypothetical protein WAO83_10795 [Fuerstiella sp.]